MSLKPITLAIFSVGLVASTLAYAGSLSPQGPGGPGGPNAPDVELVGKYDADKDGILNASERKKAAKELQGKSSGRRRGPRGGRSNVTGKPGPRVDKQTATIHSSANLYDQSVLRTVFIDFENDDWEKELALFKPSDVEIPATLTVDGKTYNDVGMSFRGASSFFMVPEGLKRSLNLSMDLVNKDQRLYGYKSLNLLNCNGDASMMSSILYSNIAREKIAAPKINFVKVVINGRSWGVYVNAQQFNKDFLKENFDTKKGTRWKVSGNPRGDAGLRYLGENDEPYRERFDIKSKDKEKAWQDLIELCKVLNQTPASELRSAIEPILDVDSALWFLAVDVALVNSDGYWTRASDYSLYQDPDGKFHILPHDMNEAFHSGHGGGGGGGRGGARQRGGRRGGGGFGFGPPPPPGGNGRPPEGGGRGGRPEFGPPGGGGPGFGPPPGEGGGFGPPPGGGGFGPPGGGGGPGHGGVDLDPLVGLDNDRFPLRSKLLQVPELQKRYLEYVREIAQQLDDWDSGLGKQVATYRKLIEKEVSADTRKLMTTQAFKNATNGSSKTAAGSLKEFAEKRAEFLLNHAKIKSLPTKR